MSRFEIRRTAKLKQLARIGPFVAGSVCRVKRRCGYPNCRCAKGQPHWAYALSYKVKGKTKTVHVPKDLVPEVQAWVNEYKRIKKLMREVSRNSVALIHRHVPASRAGGQRKGKHRS